MVGRLTKSNRIGGEALKQTALIGHSLVMANSTNPYKPVQNCAFV